MFSFMMAFLVAACGGPDEATLLDELKVVAAVAEPPDVLAGEPYDLSFTVADPLDEGGEWLAWSCLPELGCVTEGGPLDGETLSVQAVGVAPVPVWFLACAPGACDLGEADEERLLDPIGWLEELPMTGVTLASRLTRVVAEGAERNENPRIEVAPSGLSAPAEADLSFRFVVPGAEQAFGLGTGGGFTMGSFDVARDGAVELVWVAPKETGIYRLYVVFDDGEGGTAVWSDDVEVR